MAQLTSHLVLTVRLPGWYQAYIATMIAFKRAGFAIDMHEVERTVAAHSKMKLRSRKER